MEKYYFIVQNEQQTGPFTMEQLKGLPLTRETKIWYQGLDGWKSISEIPELSELEGFLPPPVGNPSWKPITDSGISDTEPPKSYLTESILVTLFCCWPFGIAAIVQAAKVEGRFRSGDIDGAQQASDNAKKYMQWSLGLGIAIAVLYFLFIMMSGSSGRNGFHSF